jgi:hypothetical protein
MSATSRHTCGTGRTCRRSTSRTLGAGFLKRKQPAINRTAGVTSSRTAGCQGRGATHLETAFGANGSCRRWARARGSGTLIFRILTAGDRSPPGVGRHQQSNPYCRLVGRTFEPCARRAQRRLKFPSFSRQSPPTPDYQTTMATNQRTAGSGANRAAGDGQRRLHLSMLAPGNTSSDGANNTWITCATPVSMAITGFDYRHNITTLLEPTTPPGPGRWLNPSSRILSRIIGNWRSAASTNSSGAPQYLTGYYTSTA